MELMADIGTLGVVAAAAVVFIGAMIQGTYGMGFGLFAAPLLALIDPRLVPALVLTLGIFVGLLPAVRLRQNIIPKELGIGILGRIVGAVGAGAVFASITDLEALSLTFGITVLCAVALSLTPLRVAFNSINLFIASIASGVMGTFTGIGAPPMGLLYQSADAAKIRATLNAFFGIGALISFIVLTLYGTLGSAHFVLAAAVSPALIVGIVVSGFIKNPPGGNIRAGILVICTISSFILVLRGLGYA